MKRIHTKALCLLLALVFLLGLIPAVSLPTSAAIIGSEIATGSGAGDRWLKADTYYDTSKALEGTPLTFEVVIKRPTGGTRQDNYMALFSSYVDDSTPSIAFGISGRRPIVTVINKDGTEVSKKMTTYTADNAFGKTTSDKIGVYSTTYMHLAYVLDPTNDRVCVYINGKLAANNSKDFGELPTNQIFRLGGDLREGNGAYYDGAIHLAAVYNTPRTAAQIAADYELLNDSNVLDYEDEALIAAWDLSKQGENGCRDRSGNGCDLTFHAGEGMRFDTFGPHKLPENLSKNPETVEAWIYLPSCYSRRGGTILGNYNGSSTTGSYFGFEINYNGVPRFFYTDATTETSYEYKFSDVDLNADAWAHIAWVHDVEADAMRFYVNGVEKQAIPGVASFPTDFLDTYCHVGGDKQKNGASQRFNAFIKELRVYSDVRTAEEIVSDYKGEFNYTDDNFILHYEMEPEDQYKDLVDLTGKGNTAVYEQSWWDEVAPPPADYAYSFAVVGDTQRLAWKQPAALKNLYSWIADNVEEKKIQYVLGLGDITENNVDEEWIVAKDAIKQIDGKVPYSLIWGAYHDSAEKFNEYFGTSATDINYTQHVDGYMTEGDISNTYHEFTVGEQSYLILCLETGAQDHILEWAADVIEAHPTHRVIITTHAYLQADGTFLEAGESSCATSYDKNNNNGDQLWEKLFSKHPNIYMVLCGHMSTDEVMIRKSMGDYGNEVTEILINPQSMDAKSTTAMVAMFYFSEDGNDVHVEYYSTARNQWKPNKTITTSGNTTVMPDDGYGDIDEKYESIGDYPLVAFVDGKCVGAASTWKASLTLARKTLEANNGATVTILLRDDIIASSSPNTADHLTNMKGTVVFDLGGHTVEADAMLFRGNTDSSYNGDFETSVILKNGTLVVDGNYLFYSSNSQQEGTDKVLNFTFEDVTIRKSAASEETQTFYAKNNSNTTKPNYYNFVFNDCTFDFSESTTTTGNLICFDDTDIIASITINGGSIKASNSKLTLSKGKSGISFKFGKGSDGNYPTLKLPAGVSAPTDSLNTNSFVTVDGNNVAFVNSGSVYRLALMDLKITGAYLNLTNDINILYSANVPAGYENPYMVFEYNGETYTVTDYTEAQDGELLFAFEGVTPQMVGENIKATLFATKDGETVSVEKAEYSVLTYCKNMLNKTTDEKLKTLLSDLLVYAAASQTYMDYKTDALVTEGLTLTPSAFTPLTATDKAIFGTADARVEWKGAALRYENAMAMKFNFKADKALTLKITVGERSEIYTSDDWETDENGNYVVYFRGILATEYDDVVTACFYDGEEQVGQYVIYSVNSYVYSMQNEGGTLGALVQATYNYGASAENYN